VPGLLALLEAGVLRRTVYPDPRLQRLANAGALDADGRLRHLGDLADCELPTPLDATALAWLQAQGLLSAEIELHDSALQLPDGQRVAAAVSDPRSAAALQPYLGVARGGAWVHGGFFLGPQA